jgi:LTXXQ motif family protein
MRSIRMSALAAALAIAAGTIGAAQAQDQTQRQGPPPGSMMGNSGPHGMTGNGSMGPEMMGRSSMGPWMMGWGGGRAMCNAMTGHIEGRLAYLKAELKISDAQEALWNTYAATVGDNAKAMLSHCNAMMSQLNGSTTSLPERLDQHVQLMAAQLDAMRAMNKALTPLYAALSDSQKQSADQIFSSPMGMMMGMM